MCLFFGSNRGKNLRKYCVRGATKGKVVKITHLANKWVLCGGCCWAASNRLRAVTGRLAVCAHCRLCVCVYGGGRQTRHEGYALLLLPQTMSQKRGQLLTRDRFGHRLPVRITIPFFRPSHHRWDVIVNRKKSVNVEIRRMRRWVRTNLQVPISQWINRIL